jgi:hypothetical protein
MGDATSDHSDYPAGYGASDCRRDPRQQSGLLIRWEASACMVENASEQVTFTGA